MKFIKTFASVIILLVSCGEAPKDKANTKPDESSMIEGFWKRKRNYSVCQWNSSDTLFMTLTIQVKGRLQKCWPLL